MEATSSSVKVSTLFEGWQKIGEDGVQLDDIKFNSEPFIDESYPNVNSADAPALVAMGKWQVANISDTKTYRLQGCTAYRWKDAEMFEQVTDKTIEAMQLHPEKIKPETLFDIACTSVSVGPKQSTDIEAGLSFTEWSYRYSLYQDPLGVWVKED